MLFQNFPEGHAPDFVEKFGNTKAALGKEASFSVKVDGSPAPKVQWWVLVDSVIGGFCWVICLVSNSGCTTAGNGIYFTELNVKWYCYHSRNNN